MRFLNIYTSEEITGKKIARIKIPIFFISLVGKHTPDLVYRFIINQIDREEVGVEKEVLKEFMKQIVQIVIKVLEDSVNDPQLKMYNGVIAELRAEGNMLEISIS